ncbi:MAG: hypothetical protein WC753_01865 [Candidatus Gracilibacteria bacterium]
MKLNTSEALVGIDWGNIPPNFINVSSILPTPGIQCLGESTYFSTPQIRQSPQYSRGYWYCLGIVGNGEDGNYLGHILPGNIISSYCPERINHCTTNIVRSRLEISHILGEWRNNGLKAEDMGLFGGRIWTRSQGDGYLTSMTLLQDICGNVFGQGIPIIGLPTIGDVCVAENGCTYIHGPQHALVTQERGVVIHSTAGTALTTSITMDELPEKIRQILSAPNIFKRDKL